MDTVWRVLTRKKVLDAEATQNTQLARVLNTYDLTALGVGSTLGVGVYVLVGTVAKETAGPAVIFSFFIAAVASVFAGLCYAEFGARTPRAGSAYIYSYVCVGEFVAFVIGWNLILEYIIGSASVARGLSSHVDSLLNGTISRFFSELLPLHIPYMSDYFDFFAFSLPVVLSIALSFGVKESSLVNNIFTILNVSVVIFVVIAGSLHANFDNWNINPANVTAPHVGKGGFFPFGIEGVIKGAATCFYGFVGFDCIATTGEEVKNPKKAIPIAIILSLFIIFLSYLGTSTVITLMVPYYAEDTEAPLPHAFDVVHMEWAKWVVYVGGIVGQFASLFGAMFPLPRVIYAMASDGLVFRFLGLINERFRTPVIGTILAGLLTGVMGAMFELTQLVNMMSIGTLLAYTIVAASVLLLRYSENQNIPVENNEPINHSDETMLTSSNAEQSFKCQYFNCGMGQQPTKKSAMIVSVNVVIYCVLCFLLALCPVYLKNEIFVTQDLWALITVAVIIFLIFLVILSIVSQPASRATLSFEVPWVPLIPALSIFCNIYLMVMLDVFTWIRFAVWMAIGFPIFFLSKGKKGTKPKGNNINEGIENPGFSKDNLSLENDIRTLSSYYEIVESPLSKNLANGHFEKNLLSPIRVLETLDEVIESFSDDNLDPSFSQETPALFPTLVSPNSVALDLQSNLSSLETQNSALQLNEVSQEVIAEIHQIDSENGIEEISENNIINDKNINLNDSSIISEKNNEEKIEVSENIIPPPPPFSDFKEFINSSVAKKQNDFIKNRKSSSSPNLASLDDHILPRGKSFTNLNLYNDEPAQTKIIKNEPRMSISKDALNSIVLRKIKRKSLDDTDENENSDDSFSVRQRSYERSKSIDAKSNDKNIEKLPNYSKTLPRIDISKSLLSSVKLKPISRPSVLDSKISENENKPDSLKFGTKEYEDFRNLLNQQLQKPARSQSFLRKPQNIEKRSLDDIKKYVDEDNIDLKLARETMLVQIAEKLKVINAKNGDDSTELDVEGKGDVLP